MLVWLPPPLLWGRGWREGVSGVVLREPLLCLRMSPSTLWVEGELVRLLLVRGLDPDPPKLPERGRVLDSRPRELAERECVRDSRW